MNAEYNSKRREIEKKEKKRPVIISDQRFLSWSGRLDSSQQPPDPDPHSAKEGPSNRQLFLHGNQDIQLLKPPFDAPLEALQAAKTLELEGDRKGTL
jgi:hypothetical protein